MSRLVTAGAEGGHPHVDSATLNGTVAIVSSPVHTGNFAYSLSYTPTGNNVTLNWTGVTGRWFYARAWFYVTSLPLAARQIAVILQTATVMRMMYHHPDGTISSSNSYGATPHSAPILANEWHCFEIGAMSDGADLFWKLRLDGNEFSSLSLGFTQIVNRVRFGTVSGATESSTIYFDDLAINDDQGSNQNSWPDVKGKIVLVSPASDLAVGANWTLGQSTAPAGQAYNSVNNTPPLGVANNVAGADPKQIRNAVASITQPAADADLKCSPYSSVVPAGNTIKILQPIFEMGHTSATVIGHVDIGVIDKPNLGVIDMSIPVGAQGNFTTFWNRSPDVIAHNPSVVLSDEAVLRIGRRTATALSQNCCFAGLMLEYEPIPPSGGGSQKFLAVA